MVEGPGVPEGAVESYFRQGKRLPKELLGVRLLFGAEMNIMNEEGNLICHLKLLDCWMCRQPGCIGRQ